ncbi:MAG: alpha/beta hydrolase [Myxococcales bacterium]|nr:alpha/beta hydrolase [Myxococcales bacterium]
MPLVCANGIELFFEETGEGEPLVLVIGIGAQLVYWPDGFIANLAERGFRVITVDNRDAGLSTKLGSRRAPKLAELLARRVLGLPIAAPYTLFDMADDLAGLVDALGIRRAHFVGVSMGGMIVQSMALRHPQRMKSLTSVMAHTGELAHLVAAPRALGVLLGPAPKSRAEAVSRAEEFYKAVGSTGFALDVESLRERAGRAYDRCFYPPGFARQMAAILASGSRTNALRGVRVPSLVIHGSVDPLVRPRGGRDTARAIPGAEMLMIDGMGHDLPAGAWDALLGGIAGHAHAHPN